MNYRFLSVEDVLALHADTIANEGGADGLRDAALLESAIAVPRATFGGVYLHPDLGSMAGAYLCHLCQAHALVDGNKRTALLATAVFLDINGHEFQLSQDELFKLVLDVASSATSKADLLNAFPAIVRRRS